MRYKEPRYTIHSLLSKERQVPDPTVADISLSISKITQKQGGPILQQLLDELNLHISSGAETVANGKAVQWKIAYYALLSDAALVAGQGLLSTTAGSTSLVYTMAASVVVAVLAGIATAMLCKTEKDLSYYRLSIERYELLRNTATHLLKAVERSVTSHHNSLKNKSDRTHSARQNWKVFTIWFYAAIYVAAFTSLLLLLGPMILK